MCGELVCCLDVHLSIPVLVSVGLLLHDLQVDVRGEAVEGFPEHQRLGAKARRGRLLEWLSCYAEEEVCVDSGVHHKPDSDDTRKKGGQGSREPSDGICHVPQFPMQGVPVGGVACVMVHVVVSSGVGQL